MTKTNGIRRKGKSTGKKQPQSTNKLDTADQNGLQGQLYRELRMNRHDDQAHDKVLYALTENQRHNYGRVKNMKEFQSALDQLTQFINLWDAASFGRFSHLQKTLLPEECGRYARLIRLVWTYIIGGDMRPEQLDVDSIEACQRRCPRFCITDRDFLKNKFGEREVFACATDNGRKDIWDRIMQIPFTIPTLETLFQDALRLHDLSTFLSEMLKKEPQETKSLSQRYKMLRKSTANERKFEQLIQIREFGTKKPNQNPAHPEKYVKSNFADPEEYPNANNVACLVLFLFVFRHTEELNNKHPDALYWTVQFHLLAQELGFQIPGAELYTTQKFSYLWVLEKLQHPMYPKEYHEAQPTNDEKFRGLGRIMDAPRHKDTYKELALVEEQKPGRPVDTTKDSFGWFLKDVYDDREIIAGPKLSLFFYFRDRIRFFFGFDLAEPDRNKYLPQASLTLQAPPSQAFDQLPSAPPNSPRRTDEYPFDPTQTYSAAGETPFDYSPSNYSTFTPASDSCDS